MASDPMSEPRLVPGRDQWTAINGAVLIAEFPVTWRDVAKAVVSFVPAHPRVRVKARRYRNPRGPLDWLTAKDCTAHNRWDEIDRQYLADMERMTAELVKLQECKRL